MAGKLIPERKNISEEHRWDLRPLFKNDEKWEILFVDIEHKIESYNQFKGRLKDSLTVFRDAIEFDLSVSREVEKLYTYAHLKSDNLSYPGFRAIQFFNSRDSSPAGRYHQRLSER